MHLFIKKLQIYKYLMNYFLYSESGRVLYKCLGPLIWLCYQLSAIYDLVFKKGEFSSFFLKMHK